MKNTYITIIVLIVLVAGVFLFIGMGKQAQAPITPAEDINIVNEPVINDEVQEVQPVKEFVIKGQNFSFAPSSMVVNQGDRVKITFENTEGFHDFVIDEYEIATTQANAPDIQTVEFTADKVGSFEYYCSVGKHREQGMRGTLVVE
jgi:nitrosocyanin